MTKSPTFKTKVALVCFDVVGERMAGPGIRYWEFARVLGQQFATELIVPPFVKLDAVPSSDFLPFDLQICTNLQEFRKIIETCDVIVTVGLALFYYPFLAELNKPIALDIYNPFLLESLQRDASADLSRQLSSHEKILSALHFQLRTCDFFVCAGEKQRDYWLGMLSGLGRINPHTYQQDPTLRRLIDIVPFGLPKQPPQHTRSVLKGVHRAITPDDKVLLWGGGIWNWFDALTLIKAISLILRHRSDIKLFFMGVNRPNQNVPKMIAVDRAIQLSKDLGLYDSHIFFNDWVPYEDRQNYLLEADIGISLHLEHIETRFSFRTRLMDYLWAGLPIVSTSGDVLGEELAKQGVAYLVEPEDVRGVADAVLSILDTPNLRQERAAQFAQTAENYRWDVVVQPLIRFCQNPSRATDKEYLTNQANFSIGAQSEGSLMRKVWRALRWGGPRSLIQQVDDYVRWKIKIRGRL